MLRLNPAELTAPVVAAFTDLADVARTEANTALFAAMRDALEDLEDELTGLAVYQRAQAEKSMGIDLSMPREQWAAIRAGASPVMIVRKFRGMTQADLSQKSGVTQAQISQIEKGAGEGSIATLKALAKALAAPLDVLARG